MLSASGTHLHSVPQLSAWIWVTEISDKNSLYGKYHITARKVGICHLSVLLSEPNNSSLSYHIQMNFSKPYKD